MAKNKTCSRTAKNSLLVIGKNVLGHPFLCTKYKQENILKLKNNEVSNFFFLSQNKTKLVHLKAHAFQAAWHCAAHYQHFS